MKTFTFNINYCNKFSFFAASTMNVKEFFTRRLTPQRISQKIDHELRTDFRKLQEEHAILLLGTGESGKTTILKQMRILHINEYTFNERQKKAMDIRHNIHDSIYQIVANLNNIKPPVVVTNQETQKAIEFILNLGSEPLEEYNREYYEKVLLLWEDNDIQKMYKRANEYHLFDSTEEFMKRLNEIKHPQYVPTTQDILYCRDTTTAINQIKFEMKLPMKYGGNMAKVVMYDVGGQRGQRKKWISLFEGIKTVLFVISTSEFDQVLREDEKTNRLEEALITFDNMFKSRYLQTNNAIIFLNKVDLLEKKIKSGISIGTYFTKYNSFKQSPDEFINTKLFIQEEVNATLKSGNKKRNSYIHFTVATSTENIKQIFDSVHKMLIEKAVNGVSLY